MFEKIKVKIFKYLTAPRMLPYYKNNVQIKNTRLSTSIEFIKDDNITIEENVFIWHNAILDGSDSLHISEGCQIGANVSIFTHSSHMSIRLFGKHYSEKCSGKKEDIYILKKVFIGKYTFIGTGSVILPGVSIGKGSVISPNSLVNINIPEFSIVRGNPCEIIGDTRRLDKRYLHKNAFFKKNYDEWTEE